MINRSPFFQMMFLERNNKVNLVTTLILLSIFIVVHLKVAYVIAQQVVNHHSC